jgi:hypothetical protein
VRKPSFLCTIDPPKVCREFDQISAAHVAIAIKPNNHFRRINILPNCWVSFLNPTYRAVKNEDLP